MNDLIVEFDGKTLTGRGWDCVGVFSLSGEVTINADVQIIKKYENRHSVVYLGRHDGEGTIYGAWALDGDNGTFAIRPVGGFHSSDLPIQEL